MKAVKISVVALMLIMTLPSIVHAQVANISNIIVYPMSNYTMGSMLVNFSYAELGLWFPAGPMLNGYGVYFFYTNVPPIVYRTTMNGWDIYMLTYRAFAVYGFSTQIFNASYILQKTIIVAQRGNQLVVLIFYKNLAPVSLDLNQYWSHIHKGTDGLYFGIYPYNYDPFNLASLPPNEVQLAYWLHGNTTLYVNGQDLGTLTSFGLWQVLQTGPIELVNPNWYVYIVPMDNASTTPQIQLITNGFNIGNQTVDNSLLGIQQGEVVLAPSQYAQYVYSIGIDTQPPSYSQVNQILPNLINLANAINYTILTQTTVAPMTVTVTSTVTVPTTVTSTVTSTVAVLNTVTSTVTVTPPTVTTTVIEVKPIVPASLIEATVIVVVVLMLMVVIILWRRR